MTVLAVWFGKLTLLALRLMSRRGNALPGLVVERLFPGYLPRALAALPQGVVIVSGTNGKTTTTKMVSTLLSEQYRVLTNDTGSNFVRGTITACIEHASWGGRLDYDVAVFELDEAWAVKFVEVVEPDRALLLNVMRDQLDRFGEIDTTARLLGQVAAATTAHLILNRDDPRIAALAQPTKAEVSFYGVAPELRSAFPNDEELYGGPLYVSVEPARAELLTLPTLDEATCTIRLDDRSEAVQLRAQGAHNAQNAAGAAAVALSFGLSPEQIFAGLGKVEPAFGRGQTFLVDQRRVVLHLVKNPAGFRQSLRILDGATPEAVVIAINDDYADGRDMSWLWDVDFVSAFTCRRTRLSTSGTRAADMAVRLHYDDVEVTEVQPSLPEALRCAVAAVGVGDEVVVFSTYTAMWALHAVLTKTGVAE
ncbi:UDP-N-acetylmuramyl tripeptide synthase [Jatrophihabitans sp. GAS493]|uniref:Mur ligase family protein n=1 Tax=Jatrophihabitans sp. GAS493 TaxID=1907575 RepID=UPI000BB85331|nr:Mur ligase family protein [Jatrophihabitans sp. GAS493]SOD71181.1 UDP-N-acetylmuramyl tripeptide synthase [Jatrophihabitans sp. GAS493]